jgi:Trm5-related predicted tRNA methylase
VFLYVEHPAEQFHSARILTRAVELKPTGHHLLEGRSTRDRSMYQIGG